MTAAAIEPLSEEVALNRRKIQRLVFLLVLPITNLLFINAVLIDLGWFSINKFFEIAAKMWLVFTLTFTLVHLIQRYVMTQPQHQVFWKQLTLHIVVIFTVSSFFSPLIEFVTPAPITQTHVGPRFIITLEIIVYLMILRTMEQKEHAMLTALALKETELNMLRSQSNPHFLFNTLNLITSEISSDPENAREIVFDFADLLRSNINMAQQSFATVSDELKLVSLYLTLQQKRFKDRITFDIKQDENTGQLKIPALLLQPVVENTVKYAVAPYAIPCHISIESRITDGKLNIVFKDSGPEFNDTNIAEGNGFRILRKTLSLRYPGNFHMALRSTEHGGLFTITLPIDGEKPTHD